MPKGPHLLIRADANRDIGAGHAIRCRALAQAWQDSDGVASCASAELTPAIAESFRGDGIVVTRINAAIGSEEDAEATLLEAHRGGCQWVALDGYRFTSSYQKRIKDAGLKLLFLDDNAHAAPYSADLVLNQNPYANEAMYAERSRATSLLLGLRYALLRREFREVRPAPTLSTGSRRLLVTMGGSDPANLTQLVLDTVREVPDLEVRVVIGPANPNLDAIRAAAQRSACPVSVLADPVDMPSLMAWADAAVAGAGSTCWELLRLRVPAVVFVVAENQAAIAEWLDKGGFGIHAGAAGEFDSGRLHEALEKIFSPEFRRGYAASRQQVDGLGALRVAASIGRRPLWLRRAVQEDCRMIWEWANEPGARAASFSPEPIPWETHQQWFSRRLHDPNCLYYVGGDEEGRAVGQVRFEMAGGAATISLSLDAEHRGFGYGARLIRLGSQRVLADASIRQVDAYIKPENDASLRAFESAGFGRVENTQVRGRQAMHYVLRRANGAAGSSTS